MIGEWYGNEGSCAYLVFGRQMAFIRENAIPPKRREEGHNWLLFVFGNAYPFQTRNEAIAAAEKEVGAFIAELAGEQP